MKPEIQKIDSSMNMMNMIKFQFKIIPGSGSVAGLGLAALLLKDT